MHLRRRLLGALVAALLPWMAPAVAHTTGHHPPPCGLARRAWLTALTPQGHVAWRTALPRFDDGGAPSPLVAGGTVYADLGGAVVAVNGENGKVDWARVLGVQVRSEERRVGRER